MAQTICAAFVVEWGARMRLLLAAGLSAVSLAACDLSENRASLNASASAPAVVSPRSVGLAVTTTNGDPRAYHARLEHCERQNSSSNAALQARMEREAANAAAAGGTVRVELRGADVDANANAFRRCLAAAGYHIQ